jgi:hypothetical protein
MLNVDLIKNVYLHDKVADVYYDIRTLFMIWFTHRTNNKQYGITFQNGAEVNDLVTQSLSR